MKKRTLDRPTLLLALLFAAALAASVWDWAATESKRRVLRSEFEAAQRRARAANERAAAFCLQATAEHA